MNDWLYAAILTLGFRIEGFRIFGVYSCGKLKQPVLGCPTQGFQHVKRYASW